MMIVHHYMGHLILQLLILFLMVNFSFAKSKSVKIKETGVDYSTVKISKKKAEIKNPVSLTCYFLSQLRIFPQTIPALPEQ